VCVGVGVGGRGWWEVCGCGDGVDDMVDDFGARCGEGPRPRFLLGWPGIPS